METLCLLSIIIMRKKHAQDCEWKGQGLLSTGLATAIVDFLIINIMLSVKIRKTTGFALASQHFLVLTESDVLFWLLQLLLLLTTGGF